MKVIVAGSRNIKDYEIVKKAIEDVRLVIKEKNLEITEIVSGRAAGVDTLGESWARLNNIKIEMFPANWDLYGKGAGYRRNAEMAQYADCLVLIWDGSSKGSRNMKEQMIKFKKPIFERVVLKKILR